MSKRVGLSKEAAENNAALNKALANPIREQIMNELADRPASPSQLAKALDITLKAASKHCRILATAGLAEVAHVDRDRQGAESFYRLTARPMLDTEHWDRLPRLRREQGTVSVARTIMGNLIESIREGVFDDSTSCVMVRPPISRMDEKGLQELDEAFCEFLPVYEEIFGKAANRMAKNNDPGFLVATSYLIHKMPEN